ncbi:BREX-1 system adenine-specific DNA-methyltransferase PglX [Lactiplantibacillus plantarum]|uniref:BREX-1 system adenine-specific DNA-methyltransferase PglX n=1 Tax=Lactiplantibacillus plantarum TaxID=1590 RepID=UPI00264D0DE2|nr:BREX-1 system adenine-specific DNA-methyltransferase PglX [Lactiplantibacillus plantarum]MDN7061142.1 BREX-1 system adenine-specific DNA-methyltransferase PglX [Lactiplantibacillus plantarum]
MDKTAIKNFAIESRRKLIAAIKLQMKVLGITEEQISDKLETSTSEIEYYVDDRNPITGSNIVKRQKLVVELHEREKATDYETAYNELVEEVAYTWFNRLIAIRFMEVNGYLPSRIRVLSSSSGRNEPDIMLRSEADLVPYLGAFSNEEQAIMVHASETEATVDMDAKYRMLFIKQANALNANLPHLFEKTNDYAELLFTPNYHVGVIQHLINDIDEADFDVTRGGQVEIIGWLYQYYNTEPKEVAISQPKSHKFRNNEIASATQIFTPDWIVKYMVQNSLGKLWIRHIVAKNGSLSEKQLAEQFQWQYYMEDGPQPKEAIVEITSTENSLEDLNIQDIKFIDPAMGSGHILVYAFDVLMDIYISEGFSKREATELIITNNLSGLDIDMRAFQLSYFSVMMKARQYNRRILSVNHSINVFSIPDTSDLAIESFNVLFEQLTEKTVAILKELLAIFVHGSEFGSLLKVGQYNFEMILSELDGLNEHQLSFELIPLIEKSKEIIKAAKLLAQPYHVVITNPPYMGSSRMSPALAKFAKEVYPNSKSDLFSMFMERWGSATLSGGYSCMVTMQSWMFLSSFEKMRKNILTKYTISNLMHMENNVMGIAFGTAVTILRNTLLPDFSGTYHQIKTTDVTKGIPAVVPITGNRFNRTNQANFKKIPGSPIAYWVSNQLLHDFLVGIPLKNISPAQRGLTTGNNNLFIHDWWEVLFNHVDVSRSWRKNQTSKKKWFPYNKGGKNHKWFGNRELIVNYYNSGQEIAEFGKINKNSFGFQGKDYYFHSGITWSALTSASNTFRYSPQGSIFDSNKGPMLFSNDDSTIFSLLGFLNSKVTTLITKVLNPTLSLQNGDMDKLPIKKEIFDQNIEHVVRINVLLAQSDWNEYENSWDFKVHPLLLHIADDKQTEVGGRLENAFAIWKTEAQERFDQLKANEEELNRIFIDLYGLNDELTPEVEDKEVSVRRADEERDIKSLLSYFIGLVFGRYSLDTLGLAYAGGEWNTDKYQKFVPNKDNLLLLNDDRYFDDDRDIMNRFRTFLAVTFGEEHVQENMDYIAHVIGKKADNSEQAIRKYFVDDFFKDHKKGYQKRPIYWEFNSGKQNGLKALMYLHRYDEGELAMMRTDYMYPLQSRYEERIEKLQQWVQDESVTKTKKQLEKKLKHVTQQLKELKQYDPIVRHVADQRINLDLDDGVLVNYEKLQDGNKILSKL